MAYAIVKAVAGFLLLLNFSIYVIISAIAGWALNKAIDHHIAAGPGGVYVAPFSGPIYFSIGNEATGFLVIFALIAGVVGAASALSGLHHLRAWTAESLASSAASATISWALTLLALGLASKEIDHSHGRNSKLKALESFVIIAAGTQIIYILLIHVGFWGGHLFSSEADRQSYTATTTAKPLQKDSSPVASGV